MEAVKLGAWVLASYLVGSIPFGLLLGKLLFRVDVREHGSRNLGATNAARVLGKGRKAATVAFFILVFLLDSGKGFVPALLAGSIAGEFYGVHAGLFAGAAAAAGHMASVYLKFRGGKGVAVSAGALAAVVPVPLCIVAGAWVAGTLSTRYISVGSLGAAVTLPVAVALWGYDPVLVVTCAGDGEQDRVPEPGRGSPWPRDGMIE
ncbi:MAG: glycerol-3-phosphate acyltransferase [Planctomycetota bacterium]|jgi:glycerol-3-phosphate acyltransferase PlsY